MIIDELHGKTRIVGDYILENVYTGVYAPGETIPSIRTFMKQFKVSQKTIQRTIDVLVKYEVLEARHGQGTFVRLNSNISARKDKAIGVVLPDGDLERTIYGNVFLGIKQIAQKSFCQIKQSFLNDGVNDFSKEELVKSIDGLIILKENYDILKDMKLPVPIVGVCMFDNYKDDISLIDLDPFSSASLAVGFFRKNNLKKVNIFTIDIPAYTIRVDAFIREWEKQGGEYDVSNIEIPITKKIEKYDGSALLFATGSLKEDFLRSYNKQHKEKLEDNNVILEFDGKSLIDPSYTKTSAISINWKQVGKMAFEELVYRIDNPGTLARRIFVPGKLYFK